MEQSYIEFRNFELLNEDEKQKLSLLNELKKATDQLQDYTEKLIRLYQIKHTNYDSRRSEPGILEDERLYDTQSFFTTLKFTYSKKVLGELCEKEISNLETLIENRLNFISDLTKLRNDNPTINEVLYEDKDCKYFLLSVVQ